MKQIIIPGTDLQSSLFCLGTDGFGRAKPEETSMALMDCFIQNGGNHLDTAALYPEGYYHVAEGVIGRYLEKHQNRSSIILATKGGHPPLEDMHKSRITKQDISEDINASLKALNVDEIDIYYLHRDFEATPVGEIMEFLAQLVKEGKIRYIGVSNWTGKRIAEANAYAAQKGLPPIAISQIRYSLAKTDPEHFEDDTLVEMDETEYDFYQKNQFCVAAFSSQAKGYFAKKELDAAVRPKYLDRLDTPHNQQKFEAAQKIAKKHGVNITAVVLAYLTGQTFPVIPIIGCSSVSQLLETMQYRDFTLTAEELASL